MAVNQAVLMRRELLTRIVKNFFAGTLPQNVDRIPLQLRPKEAEASRCCVYKDRAMLRYKLMALLGFNIRDEQDELTPLSEYVQRALERETLEIEPLTVVDEVCSACVRVNYVVTNMCMGCLARPCQTSCNKDAIYFKNGQAHIDKSKCVNCSLCMKACPFHAIAYIPVPCEESCPGGAITKREDGTEEINYDKCIYCGRCIVSCPFGAVMEKSHIIDILKALTGENQTVAMVAPAVAGQFKADLPAILGAIKELGFDHVIEVSRGADITTANEAEEFIHKMRQGQPFMTTSCCPSYRVAVGKHAQEIVPFVSHTKTPMQYTAELARKLHPDATLVFVGPCLAKRFETVTDPNADYMLSFEELGVMFVAKGIDVARSEALEIDPAILQSSRGYPVSTGVLSAVKEAVGDKAEIRPVVIDGITKQSLKELKSFAQSCPGNMVEVMACEGGCVNGCNVIANPKIAARQINEVKSKTY